MLDVARRAVRRWDWFLIAIVVIATGTTGVMFDTSLGSSAPARPAPRPFDLRTVGTPCPDDPAWICGAIRAPLDRSAPRKGTITVRFRLLPRQLTAEQSAGTIVVVAGGPGESAMNLHSWAQNAFQPILADHDLLLVDNRGTGASGAINCPKAQQNLSDAAIAQCKAILGPRADDYGTVAAVDDLEVILTRIHARRVDLYGESYGTFFAQVFALRYPQHLQRLVLDGALALNVDPWKRESLPAGLADLRTVCTANPTCRVGGDPVALLGRALPTIRLATSLTKTSFDTSSDLAQLLANAGRAGSANRELPAALRAMLNGDPAPLIRLLTEAGEGGFAAGPPDRSDSDGLLVADICADFPQPFDLRRPLAVQERQLDAAYKRVVASNAKAFLPFTPEEAFQGAASLCLGWPAPTNPLPASLGRSFPDVPTLVLEGGLDTVTPPPEARMVASEFRHSRYIEVPFVGHVAALADDTGCASSIAVAFIAASAVSTRCLAQIPAPSQVDAFPLTFAQETPATPIDDPGVAVRSANDLRTVAIARDAISDVLWRWGRLGFASGRGLRGGTFSATPAPLGDASVHLDAIRWTSDTTITGDLTTSSSPFTLEGNVVVSTPTGQAQLEIESSTRGRSTPENIFGRINGHAVDVNVDAKLVG